MVPSWNDIMKFTKHFANGKTEALTSLQIPNPLEYCPMPWALCGLLVAPESQPKTSAHEGDLCACREWVSSKSRADRGLTTALVAYLNLPGGKLHRSKDKKIKMEGEGWGQALDWDDLWREATVAMSQASWRILGVVPGKTWAISPQGPTLKWGLVFF